ncbi:MAG: hypothetical protein AAB209_02020 [Bacteroidota bacterium]
MIFVNALSTKVIFTDKDYLREFQFSEIFKFDFSYSKGDLIGGLASSNRCSAACLRVRRGALPKSAIAHEFTRIFTN